MNNTSRYAQSGIELPLECSTPLCMEVIFSIARCASAFSEKTILLAYVTVENNLPIGSARRRPVKYNQSSALFSANSAAASAILKSTVSLFPQIFRTTDSLRTKYSIRTDKDGIL